MQGIFGKMFDFNKNGKSDAGEMAAELLYLDKLSQSAEDDDDDPFTAYEYDDDEADFEDE
jgi:hypothetical protein